MKTWINDLNTTNTRILVSIALAAFGVILCLIGATLMAWEPSAKQERLLIGIGVVILTMMGFDVLQFASKRFSDAALAAAKNPNQPVNAQVEVTRTREHPIPDAVPDQSTTAQSIEIAAGAPTQRDD